MQEPSCSRVVLVATIGILCLSACATGRPTPQTGLDRLRNPKSMEQELAGWWREHRAGRVRPIHEELDRVLFCSYGPCVEYARARAPVVEEAIRAQITRSISREVASATVNDRLNEYRATPIEYAALRTVSALNYATVDEVAVEARRLLLDLRLFRDSGEDLATRSLVAPASIAAMTVKHRYPELFEQLRRQLAELPNSEVVIPLLDGIDREHVPVVLLAGLVPTPVAKEENVDFAVPGERPIRVKIVFPELPSAGPKPTGCTIRTPDGFHPLVTVSDNHALAASAMELRAREAHQRSALRSSAKSALAAQASESASKEVLSAGAGLVSNASTPEAAVIAAAAVGWAAGALGGRFEKAAHWTEKADVRSSSLVPRSILLGYVPARGNGEELRVVCSGGMVVEFTVTPKTEVAALGLLHLSGASSAGSYARGMMPGGT